MRKTAFIAVFLLFSLGAISAESPYVMKLLYPGDPSPRMKSFLVNEFRAATLRDLNIVPEVNFSNWPEYRGKLDLLIATNDPPDWFWRGSFETGFFVAQKQVRPLDDLLAKYGPDIMRLIPAANFLPNKVNGEIYSIPSQRAPTAEKFCTILARTDMLDAVGVKTIASYADLIDASAKIKARFPDVTPFASVPWMALLREAAPGWYSKDFGITLVNESETEPRVYGFFERKDIALKLNALANGLVKKGFVSEEVLTDPNNDVGRFQGGRCAFWAGAISRPLEQLAAVRKNAPGARLREFTLNPGAPRYIYQSSNEAIFIPAGNRRPEKAMQFLNWIYKSRENYELALFGVKGRDFSVDGRGRLVRMTGDDFFHEWMFRNSEYLRMPADAGDDFIADYAKWDEGAKYSKLYGFSFDQAGVVKEANAIYALAPRTNPVIWGMVDADQGTIYDDIVSSLRKAGIERYVAEYNRQLADFSKAKRE